MLNSVNISASSFRYQALFFFILFFFDKYYKLLNNLKDKNIHHLLWMILNAIEGTELYNVEYEIIISEL